MAYQSIALSRTKDVWIITLLLPAITPDILAEIHRALDEVERKEGASAVVIASSAKIFSGGMNIKWILQNIGEGNTTAGVVNFSNCMRLFGRLLTFPIPTVAAIGGHCYAGGLMLALACDHRVMSDSGANICMTEINYGLPLPRGGVEVLRAKLHPACFKDLLLTGLKYTGQQAYDRRIVDRLAPKADVLRTSIELAQSLADHGSRRTAYGLIKLQMYGKAAEICRRAEFTFDEFNAASNGFSKL